MIQAWTVVWAQWRSYRNYSTRLSVVAAIIVSVIWYGIWAGAAFGAFILMLRADSDMAGTISGALLLMTLYWQLIPMMMAASGLSLELSKLKCYPIPVRDLFIIEVLLRATASGEMLLVLIGAAIGAVLNPDLPAWTLVGLIPFIAIQMLFSLGLRDAITRLLSKRRLRELSMLIFILIFTLPRLLMGRSGIGRWITSQFTARGFSEAAPLWPWTAAGHLLMAQNVGIASAALLAWTGIALAFALWQFRRTVEFDMDAARSAGENRSSTSRINFMERIYRLPSTILGDPLGALIEKESRYLARSAQFRMLMLMGCIFGLVIARGAVRESPSLWVPNYLVFESAYALLLLGNVCIWNTFAFDRSAVQIYFLAPMPFAKVLIAKNLTAAFWVGIQLSVTLVLCAALRFPVTVDRVAEAAAVLAVVLIFLLSVGNYIAVSNPRPADPEAAMRSRNPGGMQLLMLVIYPVTFVPVALAYLARWALASNVAFYGMLAVLGAIGFVVYRVALDSAVQQAEEQKEKMVAALSGGYTPMSS